MVDYALANNRLIGMIQTKENKEFFSIGCLGKITNFTETQDGRYQINLEGINRFRIIKINKEDYKFITAEGENLEYKTVFKKQSREINQKLISCFKNYLSAKEIKFDTKEFENLDALSLAKIICVISPLDYLTKQMLLEFNNSDDLCQNLLSVLDIEINNIGNSSRIN